MHYVAAFDLIVQVVREDLLRVVPSPLRMAEASSSKRRGSLEAILPSPLGMGEASSSKRRGRKINKWRNLPPDLMEAILPHLPISALCRGRAVSKSWNELISDMDFVYPSLEHSLSEEYVLIGARSDAVLVPEKLWLADIAKNRFITVNDSHFTDHMIRKYGFIKLLYTFGGRVTLAADGGLFLVAYCTGKVLSTELYVYNPVQQIIKPMPCPDFDWQPVTQRRAAQGPKVVMATDKMTMEYTIFVFDVSEKLHIFDSITGEWEQSRLIPVGIIRHSTSVFINKQLHVLVEHEGSCKKGVMRFDKEFDIWHDYGVKLPGHDLPAGAKRPSGDAHLVVHGGKLYYILIGIVGAVDPKIEIFEVNLDSNVYTLTASMPRGLVRLLLHGDGQHAQSFDMLVAGCLNVIFFSSATGHSVTYRYGTKTWERFADNKLKDIYENNPRTPHLQLVCGTNECLSLFVP